jgi:putative ubiquitin-RnfH superfamily antitoxin RatB of RatAB toxin-antitoxin module
MQVELVFTTPTSYQIIPLQVVPGSTIQQVIDQSGFSFVGSSVGIFGVLKSLDTVVMEGDRVEILRPLYQQPMEARKERVKNKRAI